MRRSCDQVNRKAPRFALRFAAGRACDLGRSPLPSIIPFFSTGRNRESPSARESANFKAVTKLCIFVGTAVGGIAGSMIGSALGYGMLDLGSFLLSGAGSVVGVYAGWKLARKLDE